MGGMNRRGRSRPNRPWIKQHSAGGVVVRRAGDEVEFLAIMPAHRERWQLPKGTIDPGETSEQAAVREVREEGGVAARIIADLGSIKFFYRIGGSQFVKTVDFYLMEFESGDPANHDHEVQDARWFPIDELNTLAFESEQGVVERAQQVLGARGNVSGPDPLNPPAEVSQGPPAAP